MQVSAELARQFNFAKHADFVLFIFSCPDGFFGVRCQSQFSKSRMNVAITGVVIALVALVILVAGGAAAIFIMKKRRRFVHT